MGIQDRDYYREWWQQRAGYVERARFRVPEFERSRTPRGLHWSLWLVVWLAFVAFLLALRHVTR